MTEAPRLVGVVVADEDELIAVSPGLDLLNACAVPHELLIASAHLMPDEIRAWAGGARERGLQVILATAGREANLPGFVASHCILPVIGIPLIRKETDEEVALSVLLRTQEGIPIGTTGVGSPRNAAMFAVEILARFDQRWEASILKYRAHLKDQFRKQTETTRRRQPLSSDFGVILSSGDEERISTGAGESEEPPGAASTPAGPGPAAPPRPDHLASLPPGYFDDLDQPPAARPAADIPHTDKPGLKREPEYIGRISVDSEILPIDVAENATDCLLDGGIVALPTDTVYGLAVDATNPDAVASLYDLKGREADKPVAIFIENQKQLTALVKNTAPEIRHMLEAFWPGPLTVVFERRSRDFDYLAPGSTIGVRLPDHSVALALLQELRRPIACTSANPSGAPPARSGDEVEQYFGPDVHMILDVGKLPPSEPSTVIDVTREPYRLLREGPISRSQLAAVLGDLLESEEND